MSAKECHSYGPGHRTHWIAALKVHANTPREPVIAANPDAEGYCIIFDAAGGARYWHHDAELLAHAIAKRGGRMFRVTGTTFLIWLDGNSFSWLYCSADGPSACTR